MSQQPTVETATLSRLLARPLPAFLCITLTCAPSSSHVKLLAYQANDSLRSSPLLLSLQTPYQRSSPGRATATAERRSSPLSPAAWSLCPGCPWKRKARRTRRRGARRPPRRLHAPTPTSWRAAFWTSERTAPRGFSSRSRKPRHPPKHRGAASPSPTGIIARCSWVCFWSRLSGMFWELIHALSLQATPSIIRL